jgi:hypothetical protein
MRTLVIPAALAACLALLGCGGNDPLAPAGDPSRVVLRETPSSAGQDPASITRAEVRGDELVLQVTYGGGCAEHDFAVYVHPAWMESLPVQVRAQLAHDAHGDNCRALLGKELRFDLRPLKEAYQRAYSASGTVVVQLQAPGKASSTTPVTYSF